MKTPASNKFLKSIGEAHAKAVYGDLSESQAAGLAHYVMVLYQNTVRECGNDRKNWGPSEIAHWDEKFQVIGRICVEAMARGDAGFFRDIDRLLSGVVEKDKLRPKDPLRFRLTNYVGYVLIEDPSAIFTTAELVEVCYRWGHTVTDRWIRTVGSELGIPMDKQKRGRPKHNIRLMDRAEAERYAVVRNRLELFFDLPAFRK